MESTRKTVKDSSFFFFFWSGQQRRSMVNGQQSTAAVTRPDVSPSDVTRADVAAEKERA
jgi:hypothetical protein